MSKHNSNAFNKEIKCESGTRIRIAMFDAKEYDRESFEAEIARRDKAISDETDESKQNDTTSESSATDKTGESSATDKTGESSATDKTVESSVTKMNVEASKFRDEGETSKFGDTSDTGKTCDTRGVRDTGKTRDTSDHPSFQIQYFDTRLTAETAPLAKGADVVCAFVNDQIDTEVIDTLYNTGVKILAMRCAGYNNVDIEHAYKKLHIVRVPAYSPYAVAEHAIAMLLTSLRRVHKAYNRTRDFNFSLTGLTGEELHGKTVGVIGTGKIGRIFIHICRGFGMRVIAYDKFPADDLREAGVEFVELEDLMQYADVISLHCPLTDENHHMINSRAIELMKSGVIIINTSRGALIDANALLEGIKSRKIGAACLDVYEEESDIFFQDFSTHIVDDDILARLISMPNVIITSHQAYLTHEALANIAQTTLDNIEEMLTTGMSANEICYKCPKFENCNRDEIIKCF